MFLLSMWKQIVVEKWLSTIEGFQAWRAGLDVDFHMGQFTSMAENVVDILLSHEDVFWLK